MQHFSYMSYKVLLCVVLPLLFFLLFGCGRGVEISDTWPGIGEMSLYASGPKVFKNGASRASNDTFRLDSDFLIPNIGPDVTYSITSNCHRRDRRDDEPEYEKKTYSKTVKYRAEEHGSSSFPVANHLNELVLIYPTFFEKCDFKIKAKNSVGSTDSSELKEVLFEYTKEKDHLLRLDNSEVENPLLRKGLYEIRSKLKALYSGDLERPTKPVLSSSNSSSSSKQHVLHGHVIPHGRVSEAQLVCYTDKIFKINLNTQIDTSNNSNDVETISFFKVEKLHPITPNKPLENCIFTATDLKGRLITSESFDLIRPNYKAFHASLEFGDIQVLPELTSSQKHFHISTINAENNVLPDLPNDLLSIHYTNHSNEAKTLYFESLDQIATNSFFLLKKVEADYHDTSPSSKSRNVYTGFDKTNVDTRFYWSATHLDKRGNHNDNFFIIPPQSTGRLNLSAVFGELKLFLPNSNRIPSPYHGLLIAPHFSEEFTNLSLISPNEFKRNFIQKGNINKILYPNQTFSALPDGLKGDDNSILIKDHVFHILYVNKHNMSSSFTAYSKVKIPERRHFRTGGSYHRDGIFRHPY